MTVFTASSVRRRQRRSIIKGRPFMNDQTAVASIVGILIVALAQVPLLKPSRPSRVGLALHAVVSVALGLFFVWFGQFVLVKPSVAGVPFDQLSSDVRAALTHWAAFYQTFATITGVAVALMGAWQGWRAWTFARWIHEWDDPPAGPSNLPSA